MDVSKLQEIVKHREAWFATVHESTAKSHDWATEQQQTFKDPRIYWPFTYCNIFSSVQSLSRVRLFATP